MKVQGAVGGAIMVLGVAVMLWGIFKVVTTNFIPAYIPVLVGGGFAFLLYGAVLFVDGVVVSGFKNWIALALHLAANVPYFLAIGEVIRIGASSGQEVPVYLSASGLWFAIGIALNVTGIILNRMKTGAKKEPTPAAPAPEAVPAAPEPVPGPE